jgi:hypothetical protein
LPLFSEDENVDINEDEKSNYKLGVINKNNEQYVHAVTFLQTTYIFANYI